MWTDNDLVDVAGDTDEVVIDWRGNERHTRHWLS